jgi:hypothetical protein
MESCMILCAAHAGDAARMNPNSKTVRKQKKRRKVMIEFPFHYEYTDHL